MNEMSNEALDGTMKLTGRKAKARNTQGKMEFAKLPEFPPELWSIIFESVKDLRKLKNLRLVCKYWNNIIAPIIIARSHVVLGEGEFQRFIKTAEAAQSADDIAHPFKYIELVFRKHIPVNGEKWERLIWDLQRLTFLTPYSVRVKALPLKSSNGTGRFINSLLPLEPYLTSPALSTVQKVMVNKFRLYQKSQLTNSIQILKGMPHLEQFTVELNFLHDSPFFFHEWDSDIIQAFSELNHLKSINLGLRTMNPVYIRGYRNYCLYDDEEHYIFNLERNADEDNFAAVYVSARFFTVGESIKKALEAHPVHFRWAEHTVYAFI